MPKLDEIITFDTQAGRYRLTRRERRRLAILHGLTDAAAAELAHAPAALAPSGDGFDADWLFAHFDARGRQVKTFDWPLSERVTLAPGREQAPTRGRVCPRLTRLARQGRLGPLGRGAA